ncbi:MAG TPA: hypothetical protein VF071_05295 [Candidatus Limnocylindria bacterium]
MRHRSIRALMGGVFALSLFTVSAPAAMAATLTPGDANFTINVGDSAAGGEVNVDFEKAYENTTADGTPVYIYVPVGSIGNEDVFGMSPALDPTDGDEFVPCPSKFDPGDYLITQDQIDSLGDSLTDQIVAVNEAHFGPIGQAVPGETDSEALVVLAYNVFDEFFYDCEADTYTAGYFAPGFIEQYGMNVIVTDTFDWANRVGGADPVYEGVIGHELEHLLMNYSDSGELSWVDEGLADLAIFYNGWGSTNDGHMAYQQVFHRETSLTRWGGGLENYGASYLYFLYLWEQAGGNGDGTLDVDFEGDPAAGYDAAGGDLLIKYIFAEEADGMEGVQNAIDDFNADTGADLQSAADFFKDWAVTLWLDAEAAGTKFDFANVNLGPDTWGYTIEIANDLFFGGRGIYTGTMPPARWAHNKNVPGQTALPFGVSYETFRNPGPTFSLTLDGDDTTAVAAHSGDLHWYAGYESMNENILDVDTAITGGETFDFWTWYFIEEGWDYGFVEARVGGDWVTIPLTDDTGATVTTNDDPQGNNTEGNGLTGTSGGAYFVDEPAYIHLNGEVPAGATDLQFRYSTDAAYLDTGWFVDDVMIDDAPAAVSSAPGNWVETTGMQDNNWVVQIIAPCDLTPGEDSEGEILDAAGFVYRFEGDEIFEEGFNTACLRSSKARIAVVVSNMPTGDLQYLDADYLFQLTNTGNAGGAATGNGKK